jgi:hypothetical protein
MDLQPYTRDLVGVWCFGKEFLSAIKTPGLVFSLPDELKIADPNSPEPVQATPEITTN